MSELKFKDAQARVVDYGDMERWLGEVLGLDGPVELLESPNDTAYWWPDIGRASPTMLKYDVAYLEEAKSRGDIEIWKLRRILEALCAAGRLSPGNYLVWVSW